MSDTYRPRPTARVTLDFTLFDEGLDVEALANAIFELLSEGPHLVDSGAFRVDESDEEIDVSDGWSIDDCGGQRFEAGDAPSPASFGS